MLCIIGYHWKDIKLYVLDPFHLQRAKKLYWKYKPVRITQKEHLLIWNSETTQNLNIYLYKYRTETAIFLATKHEKAIMACSYLNFLKIFPSFQTFGPQYFKNETIHLNFWKHRSYLLIFSLELEIFGVAIQKMNQNSKKWWVLWGIA